MMTPESLMTLAIHHASLQKEYPKRGFVLAEAQHIIASGAPLLTPLPKTTSPTHLFLNLPWENNSEFLSWISSQSISHLFIATPYPSQNIFDIPPNKMRVLSGTEAKKAYLLNKIFFKNQCEKLPYVLAKWAMTWDGKIATRQKQSQWISSEESRHFVHSLRSEYQAILIGIGTVLADNPLLTCRSGGQNPVRVILDHQLQLPLSSKICQTAPEILTYVFCHHSVAIEKIKTYEAQKIKIFPLKKISFQEVLQTLYQNNLFSVLIEGGGTLFEAAFQENIIDEVRVFLGPKIFGGKEALTPVEGEGVAQVSDAWLLEEISCEQKGSDIWLQGYFRLSQKIQQLLSSTK